MRAGLVFVLALIYGAVGFWLLEPAEFGRNFDWRQSIGQTAQVLWFLKEPDLIARTWYARWFLESVRLIAPGTLLYACWSFFRPVMYRFREHPAGIEAARALVEKYGRTSQDYFKFSADKSFFFAPDRSAFLAYRVGAGIAVVLGDPVGPEDKAEELVASFLSYCRDNAWRVVFHQATVEFLPLYGRAGLRRLKIGDQAIVELDRLSLSGKSAKMLRSKLNTFEKAGITAKLYTAPLPDAVLEQAREVSDEWLQIPGRRERQFTLGRFDPEYLRSTDLLAAEAPDGRMLGFVNFIPSYRPKEATLDLMRRRADGPNGIMDFLFIKAFLQAREQGYERFNIGMAPMSGFQPGEQPMPEERAIHAFFQRMSFVFSFQGLRAYKAKFATIWEPRYAIYNNALDLPLLPLALERVSELPEEE